MGRKWKGYFVRRARRGAVAYIVFGGLIVHVVVMSTVMGGLPDRLWAIAVGTIVALFGVALIGAGIRYWGGYRHPIFRALGDDAPERLGKAVGEVEREMERAQVFGSWDGRVYVSDHWLLSGGVLVRLSDLVWLYPKTTKHSVNLIPTGTTRSVELFTTDRSGYRLLPLTVNAHEGADALYAELLKRAPWAFAGFRPEWREQWERIAREVESKVAARQSESYRD
ncbi:MAG: DUF6709 family protein [Polyangiales bacterium]